MTWRLHISIPVMVLLSILAGSVPLSAQLDNSHWIPPCHAAQDPGMQYIYLTTPEEDPFEVTITTGTGGPVLDGNGDLVSPFLISNSTPRVIYLGNGGAPINGLYTLTQPAELNTALNNKGLVLRGERPFYANLRVRSTNQAGSLTAKGRSALGTAFRVGHIYNEVINGFSGFRRSNFAGIMATRDSTLLTLSDYQPGISLFTAGADLLPTGPIQVMLMAGQSYVVSTYVDASRPYVNTNGFQGMLIEASAPVAVNCGSWLGSPYTQASQDMGIDQIVPVERVGTEYITIRGDGPTSLETPIVVATENDTEIHLNGNPLPAATLQAGGFYRVPPGSYTPGENLYIRATRPVYVYQMLGGADLLQTGGMNFVPPLGCSEGGSVDFIMDINRIGGTVFEGKLLVLTETGKTVWINGTPVPPGQFQPVTGKPEFRTLKIPGLSGNIKVDSDGPLQVGMFGRNNNAGWAGYFSGFDIFNRPKVNLSLASVCGDTLLLRDLVNVDSVVWYRDGQPIDLPFDTMLINLQPGSYFAVALREFCDEILWDTSEILRIPEPFHLELDIQAATCPEIPGGSFQVTNSSGGFPPYEFSLDGGLTFGTPSGRDSLEAGPYAILLRDSMGCLFEQEVLIPYEPDIPELQIAPPDTLTCARDTIWLDATGSTDGPDHLVQWSNHGGVLPNPPPGLLAAVATPGTYVLTITNLNNQCVRRDTVTVAADTLAPPLLLLPPPPLTCRDSSVQIITQSGSPRPLTRQWSFGGQALPADPLKDSLAVNAPGTYTLTLTDTHNGCITVQTIAVGEDRTPPPLVAATPGLLTCRDSMVPLQALTADPAGTWFLWQGPPGGISGDSTLPGLLVVLPGSYTLSATDTSNGCMSLISIEVDLDTIHPLALAGLAPPLTCRDSLISLQGSASGCTSCQVDWTHPAGGLVLGASTLNPLVKDTGIYLLTVENPLNGCRAMDSVTVIRIPPPEALSIETTDPDCERRFGALRFASVSGGTPPFRYSFDGGQQFGSGMVLDPAPPGTYTLVVLDDLGCRISDTRTMQEIPPLGLSLPPRILIEYGESVVLNLQIDLPSASVAGIQWIPPDHLSCPDCRNPSASPLAPLDYTVVVTDIHGCTAGASIRVDVQLDRNVYIPNAFHPDGNGINDGFTAFADPNKVRLIRWMRIYDRWGNHLFETRDIPVSRTDAGWDGTARGRPLDPGVFVYTLEVEYVDGLTRFFKGEIHLIR
jgi:gliding motility-associated-like protein